MARKVRRPADYSPGRPRVERPQGIRGQVAEAIETQRKAIGWSQNELADKAGIGLGTVGRLERGDVSPTMETFVVVAWAMGLTPHELAGKCPDWRK